MTLDVTSKASFNFLESKEGGTFGSYEFGPSKIDSAQVRFYQQVNFTGSFTVDMQNYATRVLLIIKNLGKYKLGVTYTPVNDSATFSGMATASQWTVVDCGGREGDGEVCVIPNVKPSTDPTITAPTGKAGKAIIMMVEV